MRPAPRHADPAGPLRVVHGLLAAAAGGVFLGGYMGAVTWGIDAIGAPPAVHRTTEHVRAERVAAAVEVPSGTTWDPARIHDDGKAPGDLQATLEGRAEVPTERACRCSVRTPPVVVGGPSVSNSVSSRASVPVTASDPSAGIPVTPRTSTAPPSATGPVGTTTVSSATPTTAAPQTTTATTTTTAGGSTTDDPDETTAATSSEETP